MRRLRDSGRRHEVQGADITIRCTVTISDRYPIQSGVASGDIEDLVIGAGGSIDIDPRAVGILFLPLIVQSIANGIYEEISGATIHHREATRWLISDGGRNGRRFELM